MQEKQRAFLVRTAYWAVWAVLLWLEHNLLVVPADGFGCPGYFRLSYCVANDMIQRSLPAFKAMIESYK